MALAGVVASNSRSRAVMEQRIDELTRRVGQYGPPLTSADNVTSSKRKMDELYDESRVAGAEEPPTPGRLSEWRLVAKRAIDASLELADEMEAA